MSMNLNSMTWTTSQPHTITAVSPVALAMSIPPAHTDRPSRTPCIHITTGAGSTGPHVPASPRTQGQGSQGPGQDQGGLKKGMTPQGAPGSGNHKPSLDIC